MTRQTTDILSTARAMTLVTFMSLLVFLGASPLAAQTKESTARQTVKNLQQSTLFVRLQDRAVLIEQLKERGAAETRIQEVIQERDEENKRIISAFSEAFTFSEFYFFYSSDSETMASGDWQGVTFINKDLKPDDTIRPKPTNNYYFAEFAHMTQDTRDAAQSTFTDDYRPGGEAGEPKYSGGTEIGGHALILKDKLFYRYQKPIPTYVKTYNGLPFPRRYVKVVSILDERLFDFIEED